jgi:hypothetical protein
MNDFYDTDDLTECYWRFKDGLIEYNDTPFDGDTSEGEAEFHVVAEIAEEKPDRVLVKFTPDDGEISYGIFDVSKRIE